MILRPRFVILGAMKCATTALHEQLAQQDGVFLTDKQDEPGFFSDDERYALGADWYSSLFAGAKDGDLLGDASTHYTMLPTYPRTAERMRRHLGDELKLIYLVRHPLDRLVSHFVHDWSRREVEGPLDEAVERHPVLIEYGRYATQLRPYVETYGLSKILVVFTEALESRPDEELERVARFLGLSGAVRWHRKDRPTNASRERVRQGPLLNFVLQNRALQVLRRSLVPEGLRRRMRSWFTLRQRPALSPAVEARLVARFDEELARFGAWFGLPSLCCANFREIASGGSAVLDRAATGTAVP